MSWHPDDEPADDEPLGRPFLDGPPGRGGVRAGPGPQTSPHGLFEPGLPLGSGAGRGDPYDRHEPYDRPGSYELHHHDEVRPYLLTRGRTQAQGARVAMETVVLSTGAPLVRGPDAAGLERARIVRLADRPCSTAEVAARLHLPLQVALVLVTDLVAEGLLDATAVGAQSDDVLFLERLIAGVAAL